MTKGKKITLWVCVGAMILILVLGTVLGVVIHNNKATVYGTVYGIEYKILQSDINSATCKRITTEPYTADHAIADMDLQITLRNKTDNDFIFNPDVLYINVTRYSINGRVTFENGKTSLCYSDLISSIQTVPTDNVICSMKTTLHLKIYEKILNVNYGLDYKSGCCIGLMETINFSVTYNGEKVLDFKPIINIDAVQFV